MDNPAAREAKKWKFEANKGNRLNEMKTGPLKLHSLPHHAVAVVLILLSPLYKFAYL